ncbi:MAG: methyltransferase domain-containing protein [Candidatus Nanopelagicales bacterium]|nr:methyltransferase domain-containing protein [Candidatus Nanopelagicales bacterium]MDZ7576885.1 methyltransferase domain-containing protein [Candidatus Nanopelagicales bacterium]
MSFSRWNRARKARFALDFIRRHDLRSVLLVGVAQAAGHYATENHVERVIADSGAYVVASGLHQIDDTWSEYQQCDALALPFRDDEFDLVYSNAVIEHVGRQAEQAKYVSEHSRVGRAWIITTPNRLFPIESHTMTMFRHMSPAWSTPSVTRLLSPGDLKSLLPPGSRIKGSVLSPTLTAYASPARLGKHQTRLQ